MNQKESELTLEEIRKAQLVIAVQMGNLDLNIAEKLTLEQSTLHLRNMERLLVASVESILVGDLRKESAELKLLIAEMEKTSDRLFKVIPVLRNIVKITGTVVKVTDLVK
jgi:hypothetical protein